MPTYIDIHDLPGVTAADIAKAHLADLEVQSKHGVEYLRYWLNTKSGKAFCMCTAPTADAAAAVHKEAHGMMAVKIMEVTPELTDMFMGSAEVDSGGAVLMPGSASEHDTGTRSVLFTDIVDSTRTTQRLGDEAAMAIIELHDQIVRSALLALAGREVKHTGDGIMASFFSAASAVRCGIRVQKELSEHRSAKPELPVQVRIGIAAGEPVERANDLFGTTVQLAARLCARAEPDQILVSNAVAELCTGKALGLQCIGQVALKGFQEPVQAHRVDHV